MANYTYRTCSVENCDAPHFGQGYCNRHYYRNVRRPKMEQKYATCVWCGEHKPLHQMRQPGSDRGKTPSTCYACRSDNPALAWCDYHGQPHPRERFTKRKSVLGIYNTCIDAQSQVASAARGLPNITCVSCKKPLPTWEFRGGRQKAQTCRTCSDGHPEERWCVGCEEWLSTSRFQRTGRDGRFQTVRCNPCRSAHSHGTTVRQVLERQGVDYPQCASCGSEDMLQIDHDHRCCPAARGCARCVRGYLCHQCNTSEGLLVTAKRARQLADYMERWAEKLPNGDRIADAT